ncbi:MAG: glycosyltransferase family 4 protein [Marinobacter sp.]|nr:glycosyltransferase family 4 protein [Marinobacter sp.]MCL1485102.1 glycosyltransferase family 4 protein [Marinobacter sp.]MCL1488933.1 glycosyltransferase family 4 protein [Marinobacter sp.]
MVLVSNTSWYLYNFRRGTIAALKAAGYVVVALSPTDPFSARLESELGVCHRHLDLDGKGTRLLGEAKSLFGLGLSLRRLQPAFVFNFTVKANIYSGLVCRALGIPYANNVSGLGTAYLHDSWLFRRVRALYGFANRGARRVFFQNQEDHRLFHAHGLLKATPTTVLPGSGMDLTRFAFSPLPDGPLTFVMVARLLGDKGVREYAGAAAQVRKAHPDVRCLLVGPLGISNRTAITADEVTAWVNAGQLEYAGETDDIQPFIRQAHVLVLPSYREGMPRTVLEAAAMGRPAIVSDVPGCRHAIRADETGWLCEVRSANSLAQQMLDAVTRPRGQLAAAGILARAFMEAEFDEAIVIRAYLSCLDAAGEPVL